VEKIDKLGGRLNDLYKVFPNMEVAEDIVTNLKKKIEKDKKITVLLNSSVMQRDGTYGNYQMTVRNLETNDTEVYTVGTIVIAIGTDTYEPKKVGKTYLM
jgi:heterodisulfide reductase subunit A-like polyferredoxin